MQTVTGSAIGEKYQFPSVKPTQMQHSQWKSLCRSQYAKEAIILCLFGILAYAYLTPTWAGYLCRGAFWLLIAKHVSWGIRYRSLFGSEPVNMDGRNNDWAGIFDGLANRLSTLAVDVKSASLQSRPRLMARYERAKQMARESGIEIETNPEPLGSGHNCRLGQYRYELKRWVFGIAACSATLLLCLVLNENRDDLPVAAWLGGSGLLWFCPCLTLAISGFFWIRYICEEWEFAQAFGFEPPLGFYTKEEIGQAEMSVSEKLARAYTEEGEGEPYQRMLQLAQIFELSEEPDNEACPCF